MAKVVILGAGLTGLSTAFHLEQSKFSDFKVFEQNDRPGGLLRSFQQDGFTFDFTGHLLHIKSDCFRSFLTKIAGLDHLDITQRRSAVHTHNTFTDYPFQMNMYGLPANVIYECIEGFINRKKTDEKPTTFYEWVLKHFGTGIGKHFFFPYNSKILSYDIKKIHPSWTGRFVPQTNLKAIIEGAIVKANERGVGYNSSFYYPKSGGIEFLIKQLLKTVKSDIQVNHKATCIDFKNKIVHFENGHHEAFDQLITTLPLKKLLSIIKEGSRNNIKTLAKKLYCNSVINFNLGFNVKDISTKHWLYFPEKKYTFYRLGFWKNISTSSAPKDCSAIYGELSYLPGTKSINLLEKLQETAISQALSFLNLTQSNIISQKNLHLKNAYVIYDQWREKNLPNLHKQLKNNNIHSIGRFGEWKYSSMEEAVIDGKNISEEIIKLLNKKKPAYAEKNIYNAYITHV